MNSNGSESKADLTGRVRASDPSNSATMTAVRVTSSTPATAAAAVSSAATKGPRSQEPRRERRPLYGRLAMRSMMQRLFEQPEPETPWWYWEMDDE